MLWSVVLEKLGVAHVVKLCTICRTGRFLPCSQDYIARDCSQLNTMFL